MGAFFKRPGPGTSAPSSAAGRSTPPTARGYVALYGEGAGGGGPPPYSWYQGGIEIEIDTKRDTAAGAWPCAAPPP